MKKVLKYIGLLFNVLLMIIFTRSTNWKYEFQQLKSKYEKYIN